MNITGIRKLLLRLERAANKNQDQRSKYPEDPTKHVSFTVISLPPLRVLMTLTGSLTRR